MFQAIYALTEEACWARRQEIQSRYRHATAHLLPRVHQVDSETSYSFTSDLAFFLIENYCRSVFLCLYIHVCPGSYVSQLVVWNDTGSVVVLLDRGGGQKNHELQCKQYVQTEFPAHSLVNYNGLSCTCKRSQNRVWCSIFCEYKYDASHESYLQSTGRRYHCGDHVNEDSNRSEISL